MIITPGETGSTALDPAASGADEVVCHCLTVTATQVRLAIALDRCETVADVISRSQAGGGCTACHGKIRELLRTASTGSSRGRSSR